MARRLQHREPKAASRSQRHAGRLAEISPQQRWLVPNVTSEAVAARHAQLGQAARNNFSSPQSSDQSSPFAALLDDGAGDLSPPASPALTPQPAPPGPKTAPRPPDDRATPSSSNPASTQKSNSDSAPTGAQAAGSAPAPSPAPPPGNDADQAAQALAASARKAAKDADPSIDASVVAVFTTSAPLINAVATAASSTAAALIDTQAGDTAAADLSASDTSPAATPPADPTADASAPVAPQPLAVPVSLPIIQPAPVVSDSSSDDTSGQDAAQIAALGEAVKAGALRADRAGADAREASSSAGDRTGESTKPNANAAAAPTAPSLQPTDAQPATGKDQASTGPQPGDTGGIPAAEAAANRARQRTINSQPSNSTPPPQDSAAGAPTVDPNAAAKPDPAGPTGRIEDIVREALDKRRVEAATPEPTGAPHVGGAPADTAAQSPDGASGAIAPAALSTSAAPTVTAAPSPTPTAVPIAGLAVEIASHALSGKNRFEIRLDPPELGRIDVRLDVDREGKVTSRLVVDRPETLDMLRRDAPALERSLQQAGLTTADDALQFSLRDQGGGFGGQNPYSSNNGSPAEAARTLIPDRDLPAVEVAAGYSRASVTSAGVDIRV
jgi:flagellar hook-length control protein FliK